MVAQEVRTLASRSSNASKEIRALIDTSVQHTHTGAELVRNAGATMREIVESVSKVTDVIGEISAGAKEQKESTTAAADMRRHAEHLNELVNSFVLGEDDSQSQTTLKRPALSSKPAPTKAGGDDWEEF